MNHQEIRESIETLTLITLQEKDTQIYSDLEPLLDTLRKARNSGVTLRKLFDLLKAKGYTFSPSSFAKFAQKHLKKERPRTYGGKKGKGLARLSVDQDKPLDKSDPQQQFNQGEQTVKKPRIARGDY